MPKEIAIGIQDFGKLIERNCFYIDKTSFIREWWKRGDEATLITRPRRFGKTITMSMLDCFFSIRYAGRNDLFEGLEIWRDPEFRKLQGTYPVILLSFAGVKGDSYKNARKQINKLLVSLYDRHTYLLDSDCLSDSEKKRFQKIDEDMDEVDAAYSLNQLSAFMEKYYGKKVLIFLDEYDSPMQEAYINGYWDELTSFMRNLFNNTFKTNPYMERAVMTGITRISKESIFSDLNNLNIVTTTSDEYADSFGFTENEVFAAMDEMGMQEKAEVKKWYDGFTFGKITDIYNPWSILHYLDKKKIDIYWANTSGNSLVGNLLQRGNKGIKMQLEELVKGENIVVPLDEQIMFDHLGTKRHAIWSLLLAGGYLKVLHHESYKDVKRGQRPKYTLSITNLEVRIMFEDMICNWFEDAQVFGEFVAAMFAGDVESMNHYINEVALNTFSYFDSGKKPSDDAPERFYHGFVLGLLVENAADYIITSNRESGFGRYDVILEPRDKSKTAVIMEFKVFDSKSGEKSLSDTAERALQQIEDKNYEADLLYRGISGQKIYKYGFAFRGHECLVKCYNSQMPDDLGQAGMRKELP